jgi:hypothetical protein
VLDTGWTVADAADKADARGSVELPVEAVPFTNRLDWVMLEIDT